MRCLLFLWAAFLLRADATQPVFATYLGGGGNEVVSSVTTDSQGNIYIAGRTDSPDFPVKNAIQPVSKSSAQIFIAKFSPVGEVLFSTYFGGTSNDLATGIALDPSGNIYVTGALQSHDFPVTNAFQPLSGGAVDAFVLKLDPNFQIIYSTYVGGKFNELGMAIAADSQGNAYITGLTQSPDFPTTPGALNEKPVGFHDGYAFTDAFVTKLDPAGQLVFSTFLGGSAGNTGWGIAVDNFGQAHVVGDTGSIDFPIAGTPTLTQPGRQIQLGISSDDAFLVKLSADGSTLIYSTVLGGPLQDSGRAVALDFAGNAYITGLTTDARLPIIGGSQQYLGGDVYLVSTDGGKSFTPRRNGLAAAQVTKIAFDPNVPSLVYAGTVQGVFRSRDNGLTWTPAGLDPYWIRSLAVDPSHPGTLYAGTSFGGGVFRTTDSGATWTALNSGYPGDSRRASFDAIAVDPNGSGTAYAFAGFGGISAGSDQGLFRVTANGATWTLLGHGLPSTPTALAVNALDSRLLAGTVHFSFFSFFGPGQNIPGSVYRFIDNSWVDGGLDDDIHALTFSGGTLYAAGQKFYQSTDGGQTWVATPLNTPAVATDIAVSNDGIYVLAGNLLRSTDGGQSFQSIGTAPLTTIAVGPLDSSLHAGSTASANAYVAEFDPQGTLIYSTFLGSADVERGEGIALDANQNPYIVGFRSPGTFALQANGDAFVSSADGKFSATVGPSTSTALLGMSNHGITIGPDGSVIAVMVATTPGLPTPNAVQSDLHGATDVYLIKWPPPTIIK